MKKISIPNSKFPARLRMDEVQAGGQIPNSYAGVSLIELIVVIALTGILLAAGFAYFTDYQRAHVLESQANVLSGVLRQVQVFAYTGRLNGGARPGGHGVHFVSPTEYFVFSDAADLGTALRYDAADTVIEPLTLPGGYSIIKVNADMTTAPIAGLDIVFAIPHGPVYVDGVAPSPDQRIRIIAQNGSDSMDIIVNGVSGQVEIE